jgi:putative phosphoesterase
MRLALISDIHSNLHALEAVEEAIDAEDVDSVACAGDIVGYGAFPNECCQRVKDMTDHVVHGNHDLAALDRDVSFMNPFASRAALWTNSTLSPESAEFLQSLGMECRFTAKGSSIAVFHGSPSSVDEYVYENDLSEQMIAPAKADVVVLGHTHVPFVRSIGKTLVVNPGSVGQPRDSDNRASYAVLDVEQGKCVIRRVKYDIESAARAIEKEGLPEILASRLFDGR